jgi:TerC family integral membrane protein
MNSTYKSFFQGETLFGDSAPLLPTSSSSSGPGSSLSSLKKTELRVALVNTAKTVSAALLFGIVLYLWKGQDSALEYYAAYVVEQSLSVDNLFVFVMLFDYFKVPPKYQTRVLTWGIVGAIAMRGLMILIGVRLFESVAWVQLVFAAILLWSAWKFIEEGSDEEDLSHNFIVKWSSYLLRVSPEYDEDRFWTRSSKPGLLHAYVATPLLMCLVCVELSDVVFALDSIPAVLAVSHDPVVVYTSNIFAIMGLRSLYVIIARAVQDLPFLKPAVGCVLAFVGAKMLAMYFGWEISTKHSLLVVVVLIGGGVVLSLLFTRFRTGLTRAWDYLRGKKGLRHTH